MSGQEKLWRLGYENSKWDYLCSGACSFFLVQKKTEHSRFLKYVKSHVYILGVLLLVNSLSFIMTFQNGENTTFIEKEGYNGEEKQVDFVLQKEDKTEEISLTVRPKKLTKKEQKKKMKEAFSYLEKNMKEKITLF